MRRRQVRGHGQARGEDRTKRSSDEQLEERINFAEEQLASAVPPRAVRDMLVERFGITKLQAANVMAKAYSAIEAELETAKPHFKALQVERLQTVIGAAIHSKKYSDAIRAEVALSHLLGTRAPTRVEVTGEVAVSQALIRIVSNLTADEQDRLVVEQTEIEARARLAMNGKHV